MRWIAIITGAMLWTASLAAEEPQQPTETAELLARKEAELAALQKEVDELRQQLGRAPQIQIQVQMIEVSLTELRRRGIEWPSIVPQVNPQSGPVEVPRVGVNLLQRPLKERLDDLRRQKLLKVVAEPTITLLDGRTGQLRCGDALKIPVPQKNGSPKFEERFAGIELFVKPRVVGESPINLDFNLGVTERDYNHRVVADGVTIPALTTRRIATTFDTNSGDTWVIGGFVSLRPASSDIELTAGTRDEQRAASKQPTQQPKLEQVETLVLVTAERLEPVRDALPPGSP